MRNHRLKTVCGTSYVILACLFGVASVGQAAGLVAAWGDNSYGQTRLPHGVNNIKAIVAGEYHNLALKADGTVVAWGRYYYGNYGTTNVPPGLSNVVAIAAGGRHNLALRSDGVVVAWGEYSFGQATIPTNLSNVRAIAAGRQHSLALRADGKVVAWGDGVHGQTSLPTDLSNVVAIAAGAYHGLALKADGSLAAWGAYASDGWASVPADLSNVVAIAAGASHDLALRADGTVIAWGNNSSGQKNVPVGLSNVVAIAAGTAHSMAIKADGAVVGWGADYRGQATPPLGLANAAAVAAGNSHTLALVSEGPIQILNLENVAVSYTSNATFSVLASGAAPMNYQWFRVYPPDSTTYVVPGATNASLTFSNAQFNDIGTYTVLVSNAFGSVLSEGATFTVISPPFITLQPQGRTVTVGEDIVMQALAEGTPPLSYQWRFNGMDIPGATWIRLTLTNVQTSSVGLYSMMVTNVYGSTQSVAVTLIVTDGPPHIRSHPTNQVVSVGGNAALVVEATGTQPLSYQWRFNGEDIPGANDEVLTLQQLRYEQTGYYNVLVKNPFGEAVSSKALISVAQVLVWPNSYSAPTNVQAGLANVVAVSAGSYHVLALKADGTVATWVSGDSYADRSVTNVPAGLNNVVAIAAGSYFSLALRANGSVAVWGRLPSVPSGLSNVVAIAAGRSHALAVKANGTVATWGENYSSQTNVPTSLSNVTAVAAGSYHSLALKADGTVVAWGQNSYGQATVPANVSNVIAIAAGGQRSMALRKDGAVFGWGYYPPTPPAGLSNVVAMALGRNDALALRNDGTAVRWGSGTAALPFSLTNVIAFAANAELSGAAFSVAAVGNGAPSFTIQPAPQTTGQGATAPLHARAVGVQPMSYQWQFDGGNIPGATDADLTLTNVQPADIGGYRVVASNPLGTTVSRTAMLTISYGGTLAMALNATNLVWTNAAPTNAAWFAQIRETHDGDAAAQSGRIADNQQAVLQTTVVGPGSVTFWWKVSSEAGYDFLKFYIDGAAPLASVSGETDWQQVTFSIPPGLRTLKWVYAKDVSVASGRDAGWVDEVAFTPTPPTITGQPLSQTVWMGSNVTFHVMASGAPPLSYQWLKGGSNIVGAAAASYTLAGVTRRDSGSYAVKVSNGGGSIVSSNATLTVFVPQQLQPPLSLADGTMLHSFGNADGGWLLPEDLSGFAVQASTNLVDWSVLDGSLVLTNGSVWFRDTSSTNHPRRFYRVVERLD